MKKAIIISGPTASGKSALALHMAAWHDVAIINADALQIYQGLPILSSQPSADEKKSVPHFLYSHFSCTQSCSVGLWLELVKSKLEKIWGQNKLPIIVGGSGMYISKLLDGISQIPETEESLKIEARELTKNLNREEIIKILSDLGEDFEKIKDLDKQRLSRAYEVLKQTQKSIFWWQKQEAKKIIDTTNFVHLNLDPDRQKLYQNCNNRFEIMLKNGAIEEAEALIKAGVESDAQITKTLGFLEIQDFLQQKITKEKMIEISSQKTRNYAKRQLTWFRHQFADKKTFDNLKSAAEFLKNFK